MVLGRIDDRRRLVGVGAADRVRGDGPGVVDLVPPEIKGFYAGVG